MKVLASAAVAVLLIAGPALAQSADTPFANQSIHPPVQDRVTGEDTIRTGTKADPSLKAGDDMDARTRSTSDTRFEAPAQTDSFTGQYVPERRTY